MMIRPSDANRIPETKVVVARVSGLLPPSRAPKTNPMTTTMTAVMITQEPNMVTIVDQFAAMPVARAITNAMLETFTSPGLPLLAIVGVASIENQPDGKGSQHE